MLTESKTASKRYIAPMKIWTKLLGVAFAAIILIIAFMLSYRTYLTDQLHDRTASELHAAASSLSSIVNSRIVLSEGLTSFVLSQLAENNEVSEAAFQAFAPHFIQNSTGVRNLSIYPQGKLEYLYPLAGNEAVVGLNLFNASTEDVRSNAERTLMTEQLTLLGPYELTQGGLGLVTRQSIYANQQFWGFASVVLDLPPLLEEAALENPNADTNIALRANNRYLIGDEELFQSPSGLAVDVPLPEGKWEMSAAPKQELLRELQIKLAAASLLCTAMVAVFLYFLYIQYTKKEQLQALIKERTENLESSNLQLASTYLELQTTEKELRKQLELLERQEQGMRHMAYHDSLTGLYNRAYFNERIELLFSQYALSDRSIAILYLDIDNFKLINDTIGHYYGDRLLNMVGNRLAEELHYTDTIARMSGDKFAVILTDFTDTDVLREKANHAMQLFHKPFTLKNTEHLMTASIGIVLYPEHGQNITSLLKNVDTVMSRIKESGKNQILFYDRSLASDTIGAMETMNNLRHALEQNEFLIYYQPQVEAKTGAIVGLEALIRWNHPTKGMIPPGKFISIAENTGLIVPIGERVLELVCAQSQAWQKAGIPPIKIAVNLSARQLLQKDLTERMRKIFSQFSLDPNHIELEITENMAMRDDMQSKLHELRAMGLQISIDDFGTHYSSLSYLKQLPVDKIKIDRSFVNGIANDYKDEAIIQAMLLIAERLELNVIAEGVETKEQLSFLIDNNCTNIQGFFYYKPLPTLQIEELLLSQARAKE